jgi:hypothetical protein
MPATRSRRARLWIVAFAAAAGGLGAHALSEPFVPAWKPSERVLPYPHHVPKTPGGVSLRFAMVQDVIHERYARHGRAYFAERNRGAREDLARLPPGGPWDAASDDLAAGLDGFGDHDGAVRVMRDKLASQTERGVAEGGMYATYANLGTFLVHANLSAAQSGDAVAKVGLREGLNFIRKAIAVKPDAHFGREQWQTATVEFLLAGIDNPDLLRTFDLIGNRLDIEYGSRAGRAFMNGTWPRSASFEWAERLMRGDPPPRDQTVAQYIQDVGAEEGWPASSIPSHTKPVPFDEPVLGIVGTWRESGPTPHFALCLGETMVRVGQRYLAWCAFERAARMADESWPDPKLQEFLREHCRRRQELIEIQLPADEVAKLRPRFDAELEYGQGYQRAYQQYEADQIADGRSIEDEHFYDAFHAGRGPIASPVGPEDELRVVSEGSGASLLPGARAAYTLFGMGAAALGTALLVRRADLRRAAKRKLPPRLQPEHQPLQPEVG